MLRRGVILGVVLMITIACVTGTTLLVLGSRSQFQSRLQASWSLGRLRIDKSTQFSVTEDLREYDPRQIQLKTLVVTNQRHKKVLRLEDVVWNRVRLFPESDGLDLQTAEVRFDSGELFLSIRDGSQWDHEMILSRAPADWGSQIPARVAGSALTVRARRKSSSFAADLKLHMEEPRFQRQGKQLSYECFLSGVPGQDDPPWSHGQLKWTRNERGVPSLEVSVDDANLKTFPYEALRNLFDLPWPRDVRFTEGHGALDWTHHPGSSRLEVNFHRARLDLPMAHHAAKQLRGSVRFLKNGPQVWNIDHGIYSRSVVSGYLEVRPDELAPKKHRRRVQGDLKFEHILEDRGIGDGLPEVWAGFLAKQRLGGSGTLLVEVDGVLSTRLSSLIKSLRVQLVDAGVHGYDREDSLTGEFDLTPSGSNWLLEGKSEESLIGGLRVPAGRWTGRFDAARGHGGEGEPEHRLLLERVLRDPHDVGITLEVSANPQRGLNFTISISRMPLAELLGLTAVGSGARVTRFNVTGTWQPGEIRDDLEWEGVLEWEGMELTEGIPWPVAPWRASTEDGESVPGEKVDGFLTLRHRGGRTTVRHLQAKGSAGSWLAQGYIREGGFWDLTGATVDTTENVFGSDTPLAIEEARARFRIQGPLLRWKVDP